jgi:hypothetical protein
VGPKTQIAAFATANANVFFSQNLGVLVCAGGDVNYEARSHKTEIRLGRLN